MTLLFLLVLAWIGPAEGGGRVDVRGIPLAISVVVDAFLATLGIVALCQGSF